MAVLRAAGANFDVDRFCAETRLSVCRVFRREERLPNRRCERPGVTIAVCDAQLEDLPGQIDETIAFLTVNEQQIQALRLFPGVEDLTLDFWILRRDVYAQFDRLPPELVRLAGSLGLGIELSQYLLREDNDDKEPGRVPSH
jgi:hypothetical protein